MHELRVHNHVAKKDRSIAYYRTAAGLEIDFVIETAERTASASPRIVCLEVKASARWKREWEAPMRALAAGGGPTVDRMIGVYTGRDRLRFDSVDVMPADTFLAALHAGEIF